MNVAVVKTENKNKELQPVLKASNQVLFSDYIDHRMKLKYEDKLILWSEICTITLLNTG
ncbi:hypothetical protein CHS0354_035960, partial [Potamilus streckersoni]